MWYDCNDWGWDTMTISQTFSNALSSIEKNIVFWFKFYRPHIPGDANATVPRNAVVGTEWQFYKRIVLDENHVTLIRIWVTKPWWVCFIFVYVNGRFGDILLTSLPSACQLAINICIFQLIALGHLRKRQWFCQMWFHTNVSLQIVGAQRRTLPENHNKP